MQHDTQPSTEKSMPKHTRTCRRRRGPAQASEQRWRGGWPGRSSRAGTSTKCGRGSSRSRGGGRSGGGGAGGPSGGTSKGEAAEAGASGGGRGCTGREGQEVRAFESVCKPTPEPSSHAFD
eukprot:1136714-Pelagomonas_calceolata.AAC.1